MDVFEAIKGRRSVRQYTDEPIPTDVLEKLLDAARWAPTASNQQRWRFVAVTSPEKKELFRQFAPGIFDMPAAFILLCIERASDANELAEKTYLADCSVAAQNIMLAAYALGIGTCVAISYAKVAIAEILDIPEDVDPLMVITLGYPAEDPTPPARLAINQIAFMDEYGKEWPS